MATLAVPSADDSGPQAAPAGPDPRATEFYLNRELTWLDLNYRIPSIAADTATPLLERVKFLAIVSSNLDEFFMKRIGGLKQQLCAGITDPTVDGRTPRRQIDDCTAVIRRMYRQKRRVYLDLIGELAENGGDVTISAVDDDIKLEIKGRKKQEKKEKRELAPAKN